MTVEVERTRGGRPFERPNSPLGLQHKVYSGYHGKHCYDENDVTVCGWPELHAMHDRQLRRERKSGRSRR